MIPDDLWPKYIFENEMATELCAFFIDVIY